MIQLKIATAIAMLLLGYIAQVSAWEQKSDQAIFFTDIKLDDLTAIHVALKHYNKLYIVLTGIFYQERAHAMLRKYLDEAKLDPNHDKVVVLAGNQRTRIPEGPVDHEMVFPKDGTKIEQTFTDWALNSEDIDEIDIYQIAQTHATLLTSIPERKRSAVKNCHLVHGFNSGQSRDKKHELEFTQSFKTLFPKANIIFTNNYFNFESSEIGQTTAMSNLKRRIPQIAYDFVNAPIFAFFQIIRSGPSDTTFDFQSSGVVPEGFSTDSTGLWQALKVALYMDRSVKSVDTTVVRDHFLKWFGDKIESGRRMKPALDQLKNSNAENGSQVEICDALHVIAVLNYKSPLIAIKMVYNGRDVIFEKCDNNVDKDAWTLPEKAIKKETAQEWIRENFPERFDDFSLTPSSNDLVNNLPEVEPSPPRQKLKLSPPPPEVGPDTPVRMSS